MLRLPMQPTAATNDQEPRFLTLPEASRLLGLSIDTLRRRIKDGSIPAVLLVGRYRIREDHLREWVESKAVA